MSRGRVWEGVLRFREVGFGEVVEVEGVRVDGGLFRYVADWLDRVEARYSEDVAGRVALVYSRSLRELVAHRVEDFVEYGGFRVLDSLTHRLKMELRDPRFEPRPCMVVLYGPPGTGKTTWARHTARRHLVENGVVKGLYLEVSTGDLASKWAGVPVNTLRSIIEAVKTRDFMSILLIDEADAVLARPRDTGDGASLEQVQLVAEAKSQLSFITEQPYPAMIVLTTNYRDALARADEALADRVTAWIEVPPPPPRVRLALAAKTLQWMMRQLLPHGSVVGEISKYRALLHHSVAFWGCGRARREGVQLRWYTPVLPFDADYLVGLLTAWGWNPLEVRLDLTCSEAVRVWSPDNPVYQVYARVLVSLVELYRVYTEREHGISKSFLRAYRTLRRGVEDATRLHVHMYVDALNALAGLTGKRGSRGEAEETLERIGCRLRDPEKLQRAYELSLMRSLFFHPVNPVLLVHCVARYAMSDRFTGIVNDVMSLGPAVTWGIRFTLAPQVLGVPRFATDCYSAVSLFRVKLDLYNRLVVWELREGGLLTPLRVMYTVSDLERAWGKAVRLADTLPEDIQPYVKIALLPLKVLHPAIHSRHPEEKARKLYETVADYKELEGELWSTVEELGIVEDVYLIQQGDNMFSRGGRVWFHSSSLMVDPDLPEYFTGNPYFPHPPEELGAVFGNIWFRSEKIVRGGCGG